MKFKLTNIRINDNEMIAFYEFADGTQATNKFTYPTDLEVMNKWGEERALYLEKRAIEIKEMELIINTSPEIIEQLVEEEVLKSRDLNELIAEKIAKRIELETKIVPFKEVK